MSFYSKLTRRTGKGAKKLLGELELEIMRVAWRRESVTVRDVLAALEKKRSLAYTTVMTLMGRLEQKGLLVSEKDGKSYRYRAAHTREEFEAQAAGQVVRSLIHDFGGEIALAQFIQQLSEVDPTQLARLEALARAAQTDEKKE
ncbi:MAG: BlaI/MecI/CopY family transcriptional regulator [Anaerolineales bacterium]